LLVFTALEPFFNAAASQFILGQQIPVSLWLSLAPIVLGKLTSFTNNSAARLSLFCHLCSLSCAQKQLEICSWDFTIFSRTSVSEFFWVLWFLQCVTLLSTGVSMASLTELSFNWKGFISAMTANVAFTYRNIYSKKAMVCVTVIWKGLQNLLLQDIAPFQLPRIPMALCITSQDDSCCTSVCQDLFPCFCFILVLGVVTNMVFQKFGNMGVFLAMYRPSKFIVHAVL